MNDSRTEQISAVAAISDPQRRALLEFVSRNGDAVTRDEAATATGMPRSTAAFHLDRLVSEGVLEADFKRLSGKTGPGSGRPSKLYRRAGGEINVSIPARRYELAGDMLAAAVEESDRTGAPVRTVLATISSATGREIGAAAGSLDAALESCGYEPRDDGEGGLVLTNCPFHKLATNHTDVICSANVALLQGVADGAAEGERSVEFVQPSNGCCCVRITAP
ncbi:putative ArsR family transcriptional regulator [Cryobacterium mesophilum]|uniref:Winged helix-turn-helix transcriptional regulator n=1 Tax=Terrimesophilobacter mesophilus TaxID=433647 RepID=A0A4V3I9H9_9MICO|nr:helix-turn-helix domain-containing protein [Terrimesophilobacter mesophilus]MBB5632739.1 putative ArsR family transcriptional regulator [Terrimesophilobacter mesophilus]TFB79538.1 winged helix-turn-helix transcriptional regulator [Terrimesophilobacter mesophilus]